jgi:glycosyltransferase involved in cell wall biosynthesis
MSEPGIAVVVPVYEGERFLAAALESVRAQSRPADEVVVVDDGSTDGGAAVAVRLARDWPALRVVRRAHAGLSATLNAGIAATRGELVTFLDCDDLMVPTRLEQQAAHLAAHPGTDVVIGREEVMVEEGAVAPAWIRAERDGTPRPAMMSLMVRRPALERVGGFDTALRVSQDLDWMVRARVAGLRMDTLDAVLMRRRMHGDNMVYATDDIRQGMLQVLRNRIGGAGGAR